MSDKLSQHFAKGVRLPKASRRITPHIPAVLKKIGWARIVVVLVIMTAGATWLILSHAATPYPATRDIYQWPFSKYSIWNMPIGKSASYTDAGIRGPYVSWGPAWDFTPITMDKSAPVKASNQGNSHPAYKGNVHVSPSNHWSSNGGSNWNGQAAFLLDDNKNFVGGQILDLVSGGSPSWNIAGEGCDQGVVSLSSAGLYGCHGGSGLSTLGGVIRQSDVADKNVPIRHALSVSISCSRFCSTVNNGFRPPAIRADAAWANPVGSDECGGYGQLGNPVPDTRIGSLLALPQNYNVSQFPAGSIARQIAETLRDYGAYVVDESCANTPQVSVEQGVPIESESNIKGNIETMWDSLQVIKNNYTGNGTNIGGGGAPINDSSGAVLCYAPPASNTNPSFIDEISANPNGVSDDPSCPDNGGGGGTTNQPPTASVSSSVTTGAAPLTATISANASDSDGTISKIELYQSGAIVKTVTSATSLSYSAANLGAGTYTFYVNATDNSGSVTKSNTVTITVSGVATAPLVLSAGTYDDTLAVYCGDANTVACPGGLTWDTSTAGGNVNEYPSPNGADHYTNSAGLTVTVTFSGTGIEMYGSKAPANGQFQVKLDNTVDTKTYDAYGASRLDQQLLYSSANLSAGTHTLTITVLGTKQSSSSGTYVSIDKLVVRSSGKDIEPENGLITGGHTAPINDVNASAKRAIRFKQ